MIGQHVWNTLLLSSFLMLIGFSFFFSTISCRHFNFAAGAAVILAPYAVIGLTTATPVSILPALLVALALCLILGMLYRKLSAELFARGSRSGQMLIVSLALLGVSQSAVSMTFGTASQPVLTGAVPILGEFGGVRIASGHVSLIVVGSFLILALSWAWEFSGFGRIGKGLIESRLALGLRGYRVGQWEYVLVSIGFGLGGMAGILWGFTARVRPSMAFEAGLIGIVANLVGPLLARGLVGVALASLGIALLRLFLSLLFEGDWSMTAMLLLLLAGIVMRQLGTLRFSDK